MQSKLKIQMAVIFWLLFGSLASLSNHIAADGQSLMKRNFYALLHPVWITRHLRQEIQTLLSVVSLHLAFSVKDITQTLQLTNVHLGTAFLIKAISENVAFAIQPNPTINHNKADSIYELRPAVPEQCDKV